MGVDCLQVSLLEALAGFRQTFRHLSGDTLNLACEGMVTRPGELKRVRGCGMPRLRGVGKGDLYLRMAVRFPRAPLGTEATKTLRQLLPRTATASKRRAPPHAP